MKFLSPIKQNGERRAMSKVTLEAGLTAFECPVTNGIYIPAQYYSDWLRKQPAKLEHLPEAEGEIALEEGEKAAMLCPETNTLMSRYKVGYGFKFTLDRSITGGIWLDAGEWDELKKRQFHDELHLVFTAPWQKSARDAQKEKQTEARLKERFGDELLLEMQALREKLLTHEYRDYAIAYLDA